MAVSYGKNCAAILCVLLTAIVSQLSAQNLPDAPEANGGAPIPVITGFMSYQSNISPGTFDLNPEFDPVVLLPIGNRLLLQAEFDMSLDVAHTSGSFGPAVVAHGFDYLQASYFAHPNLTVVAGRFLVPFGIYRERMHPLWVRYLQAEPISFTLNATSGNGAMVRGGMHLTDSTDLTYSAYYSAADTNPVLRSDKQAGFRSSVLLLNRHMEAGTSYNHTMGDGTHTMFGTDFSWSPRRVPVEIRSETLFSKQAGNTYWVEGEYKLSKLGRSPLLRYTQLAFRQELASSRARCLAPAFVNLPRATCQFPNLPHSPPMKSA